jgi:nucleoside-diphosphate-sugar epimerase
MSKYFITGGAGFLGINLIRLLLDKGHEVISYDINKDFNYPEKNDSRVRIEIGDIRDFHLLKESMRSSDIVIHAAAALPLYSKDDIYTTDVDGTRNVMQSALELGIGRVIMISSTAVYGIPKKHPLFEDDPMVGVGAYGKAKIKAEEICSDYRKLGMIIPIIRPKSFVGPERLGVFSLLFDWAIDGKNFPVIGSGNNRYQLLDVYDLCEAIYLCSVLSDNKVNNTFNIGAEVFTTMKEDYQAVLDKAGYGKKIIGFPALPLIIILRILELFRLSPLYKWVYETASKDSFVSIDKAKRILGFTPAFSNKDALLRNFDWFVKNRDNFKESNGVDHRKPWKQGVLKIVKVLF